MEIKKFSGELSVLLGIFNDARNSALGFPGKEVSLDEFKMQVEGEQIYVATMDKRIVGFVSVWEDGNFIHHLYVDPAHQNRNIGRALIDKCKEILGLPLSLKCIEKNTGACSFYEKNGWVIDARDIGPEGPYILYILKE